MTTSFVPSTADISHRPDEHPLGVSATSETTPEPGERGGGTDLRRVLAVAAGVVAAGGGLIHLSVIRNHTDYLVVAAGFAAMGISQCILAMWLFRRPSRRAFLAAAGLHASIAATWALSRTFGLPLIPGESAASEIGVADLVANTFSLGVIGLVFIASALGAATPAMLPRAVALRMVGAVVAGALVLTAIGASAPHVHASHEPTLEAPVVGPGHDHGPPLPQHGDVTRLGSASH
ncbi:MAG: hypothetical protein ACRD2W_01160 [Acidimicrobiales bacterium]